MRYALTFAGLVVMAVAAPIEMGTDRSYGTYDPYKNYGTYSVAVGMEAANMQRAEANAKRSTAAPVNMAADEKRMKMAADGEYDKYDKYASYGTYYGSYTPYSAAVEAEAAKADVEKRHKMKIHVGEKDGKGSV
ncbi:hypothetical protein HBI88_151640 [Parastagonospora nodorum]|nr:hypothetical protein HBH52_204970 [Parastagonospora nodorum]KAH3971328.1 hypothetical protein HBH51_110680 [Parastagonospora nodorum]KAH4058143.1 hypothetical protein HBH49_029280 [Parastagonospora nodorum]KAH4214444.1 hypothetical protein HBI95_008100 [Parastagonospora nodorum]KAH4861294.1 hypothetical protein HBH75_028980 [Parastagonospora nodorum]